MDRVLPLAALVHGSDAQSRGDLLQQLHNRVVIAPKKLAACREICSLIEGQLTLI